MVFASTPDKSIDLCNAHEVYQTDDAPQGSDAFDHPPLLGPKASWSFTANKQKCKYTNDGSSTGFLTCVDQTQTPVECLVKQDFSNPQYDNGLWSDDFKEVISCLW